MRYLLAITFVSVAISGSVVSCGEDPPAVCGSAADLQASVGQIREIDFTAFGAVSELKAGLSAVENDLAEVKSDAASKFGTQVDAVERSYEALRASLASVESDATAATLAEAGAALSTFGTDVRTLVNDIQSTC